MVKEFIRRVKQSMAPKGGDKRAGAAGGIFLKSPDVFQLKYLNELVKKFKQNNILVMV